MTAQSDKYGVGAPFGASSGKAVVMVASALRN